MNEQELECIGKALERIEDERNSLNEQHLLAKLEFISNCKENEANIRTILYDPNKIDIICEQMVGCPSSYLSHYKNCPIGLCELNVTDNMTNQEKIIMCKDCWKQSILNYAKKELV